MYIYIYISCFVCDLKDTNIITIIYLILFICVDIYIYMYIQNWIVCVLLLIADQFRSLSA